MTQVAWKVCNSICHCYYFVARTVTVMLWLRAFSVESAFTWTVFKSRGKVFISSLWRSIKCPLLSDHISSHCRLTFQQSVLLCCQRKEVRNEVGRRCWTDQDKGRMGKVTFRLAADWRICVNVRENSIYCTALIPFLYIYIYICVRACMCVCVLNKPPAPAKEVVCPWKNDAKVDEKEPFYHVLFHRTNKRRRKKSNTHTRTHNDTLCPESVRASVPLPLVR